MSVGGRRLSFGLLAGMAGQFVFLAGTVMVATVLTRQLSIADFGTYSLATTVTFLAAIIVRLGLHSLAIREISPLDAVDPKRSTTVRTFTGLSVAVAGVSIPILGFAAVPSVNRVFMDSRLDWVDIWLIALTIAFEAVRFVASEIERGLRRQGLASLLGNAGRTTVFLGLIGSTIIAFDTISLKTVLILAVTASSVTALAAYLTLARQTSIRPLMLASPRLRKKNGELALLRRGSPFMITELTGFLYALGDVLVVGLLLGQSDVAVYAVASRAAGVLALFTYVLVGVLSPVIAANWQAGNISQLQRIVSSMLTIAAIPTTIGLLICAFWGDRILGLLFGSNYSSGYGALVILAVAAGFNAVFGFGFQVLMFSQYSRIATQVTVVCSILTVIAEMVSGLLYGLVGVAFASAAGIILQQTILTVLCWRLTSIIAAPGTLRLSAVRRAIAKPAE